MNKIRFSNPIPFFLTSPRPYWVSLFLKLQLKYTSKQIVKANTDKKGNVQFTKRKKLNIGALDFDISTTGLSLKDALRRGLNLPPHPLIIWVLISSETSLSSNQGFIRNVGFWFWFWMHVVFLLILLFDWYFNMSKLMCLSCFFTFGALLRCIMSIIYIPHLHLHLFLFAL